jgi:CheY-like chemotaxis protein
MDKPRRHIVHDQPTILLVEDRPDVRAVLIEVLQDEGFAVMPARDVPETLREARARVPDLIVLDLAPHASTQRVLTRFRDEPAVGGIPLVVTHRRSVHAQFDQARHANIHSSIPDVDALLEHVWRMINTRILAVDSTRESIGSSRRVRDPPMLAIAGGRSVLYADSRPSPPSAGFREGLASGSHSRAKLDVSPRVEGGGALWMR